jgi:tetratricopeptide (TPR) repeat protein
MVGILSRIFMKKYKFITFLILLVISNCSLQKIALRSTTNLLNNGIQAIYQEQDLQIAEHAIASDMKLLEGLYQSDPRNKDILILLTQGYASYSMGFVEDEDPDRAKLFYLRARQYGLELLGMTSAYKDSIPCKEKPFIERLAYIKAKDVPALFWTAFAWGGWINLSKDDPQAIFDLGKVKAMMSRVLEIDEGFFFGAAHLFFGSIYGTLPKLLGGDPEKAKEHFNRSLEISDNNFILPYVYLARYYAQPLLDEALFGQYLEIIEKAPIDVLPGYQLLTAIAKDKARKLSNMKEELF